MVEQPVAPESGSSIGRFFESIFSVVAVFLLVVGLASVTAKWDSSRIEFVGADGLTVTRSTWWGMVTDRTSYRPSLAGWVQVEDGKESPVSQRPVVLNF